MLFFIYQTAFDSEGKPFVRNAKYSVIGNFYVCFWILWYFFTRNIKMMVISYIEIFCQLFLFSTRGLEQLNDSLFDVSIYMILLFLSKFSKSFWESFFNSEWKKQLWNHKALFFKNYVLIETCFKWKR